MAISPTNTILSMSFGNKERESSFLVFIYNKTPGAYSRADINRFVMSLAYIIQMP